MSLLFDFTLLRITLISFRNLMGQSGSSIFFWMTLLSSCFLAFSVQLGVQSMPHLLSGELYPKEIRAKGKSISRAITCILIMVTLKLHLPLKIPLLIMECSIFLLGLCCCQCLWYIAKIYLRIKKTKNNQQIGFTCQKLRTFL